MKSFFIKWRLKARRDEVRRQNEFFEKLLADASPTSYEDRKLFLSTSRTNNATSEQQDTNMIGMFPNSDTCLPVLWSVLEWFRAWTGRAFFSDICLEYRSRIKVELNWKLAKNYQISKIFACGVYRHSRHQVFLRFSNNVKAGISLFANLVELWNIFYPEILGVISPRRALGKSLYVTKSTNPVINQKFSMPIGIIGGRREILKTFS